MLKTQLDKYVIEYETKDFIKNDPIQFIHRYNNIKDIEIVGFIASMFAYGKREVFIEKLNYIFNLMGESPYEYIKKFDYKSNNVISCDYRFSRNCDLIQIFKILNILYSKGETIGTLFEYYYNQQKTIWGMLQGVVDYFYSNLDGEYTNGFYHLLPNPKKKSALKRLNMLLRWFVRDGEVDIGIWKFIPKSELLIPIDTHVAKISRKLGLLKRNDNGYESVIELTNNLKAFDYNDPIKYDFALFGYGVNN